MAQSRTKATFSAAPQISVIVPAFNREHLIGETLESLLRQSLPPREIIVVDDGSADNTCGEVERFGSRVISIRQKNEGPGAARNTGFARASCGLIQFFDSDDLASRNLLECKARTIANTGADIAYGPWLPVWLKEGMCRHDGFVRQSAAVPVPPLSAFLCGWVLFIPNCLIRREALQRCGGYPTHLRTSEDLLLMFRLLHAGARLAFTPHSLMLVRQHPADQISAAPASLARRVKDHALYTGAVMSELSAPELGPTTHARPAASYRDLMVWRALHTDARTTAFALRRTGEAEEDFPEASWRDLMLSQVVAGYLRIELAIRSRLIGHRIPGHYCARPFLPVHADLIQDLGYTTRQSSPFPAQQQRNLSQ